MQSNWDANRDFVLSLIAFKGVSCCLFEYRVYSQ